MIRPGVHRFPRIVGRREPRDHGPLQHVRAASPWQQAVSRCSQQSRSLHEGRALLNSWRQDQQEIVMQHVFEFANYYQQAHREAGKPGTDFPRVPFPWFSDGEKAYRTSLLDFTELYDFVTQEEG